ncbi:arsenic resistance protein [Microbacterium marinilacus]|uniref:arsenic resistance protein n=1 Tax=Microbacterium marinilacus TaxID=415209 RepID=UPI003555EB1D
MSGVAERMERHQVALYVVALALGAAVGLLVPAVAAPLEAAITPVLGLLLYTTFVGVPLTGLSSALRDVRFLATLALVDFVAIPVLVFLLSRLVAADEALLVGVLFVLLTPCVDYVIVFAGLAGGAKDRLLAATPLLMLGQMLLLPLYLWWMAGPELVGAVDLAPFVEAFVLLIVTPLVAAAATQVLAARVPAARALPGAVSTSMVPLMMATLAIVVASQIAGIGAAAMTVLAAVPVFVMFVLIALPLGAVAGRLARLEVPARRAVAFSGVTRNSLVVLPLVLALPDRFDPAPLVVVTQTLVELVAMVVLVRLVPRAIR